jgi:hypothetical protein
VKSELVQLEKAGYSIYGTDLDYPNGLKAAEARVAAGRASAIDTSYGTNATGTSTAGSR